MKKKIILIMLEAPIPFGGAAARWYFVLLNQLIKNGHDVSAFSAVSKKNEIAIIQQYFPKENIKAFLFPKRSGIKAKWQTLLKPYSYMFSDEMQESINQRLKEPYDVIHLEQLWTTWLIKGHEKKSIASIHYLSAIDLELVKGKDIKERMYFWLMKRTEKKMLSRLYAIKTCSKRLEKKIHEWFPEKKIISIPFAIDHQLYPFTPNDLRPTQKRITLIASMDWYPGKSAAIRLLEDLWPTLYKMNPDCVLTIVGWHAKKELKKYLELQNIEIYENVPDIHKFFINSSILLYAPCRGSGMKIKILESMLYGIPIVTTGEGVEGLDYVHRIHALVSDENSELIQYAHELLNNFDLQQKLRFNARKLVEMQCSVANVVSEIENFYSIV